jgi:hypothetical protein
MTNSQKPALAAAGTERPHSAANAQSNPKPGHSSLKWALDQARRDLVDLSRRNRLLHAPLVGKCMTITSPAPDELFEKLRQQETFQGYAFSSSEPKTVTGHASAASAGQLSPRRLRSGDGPKSFSLNWTIGLPYGVQRHSGTMGMIARCFAACKRRLFSLCANGYDALMKIVSAIVFAAVSGVAFAQSPPCMPGGICCINGNCGTLEQFNRNATIVCLQADAIENKSLAQSIDLAGRCNAAQIMAGRVEDTQKANAREHQLALEAQRKLREMGAPLPAQSSQSTGTVMPTQDPLQRAGQVSTQAMVECRDKRLRGELPTHVASVKWSNPRMIQAFSAAHFKYMDLIEFFAAKQLELATRIDRNELTEDQARVEGARAYEIIVEALRRRALSTTKPATTAASNILPSPLPAEMMQLTQADVDSLLTQIRRCWTPPGWCLK